MLALLWLAGFAWFLRLAERTPPPPSHADGIVALTGGAGRVETALRLLAEGRARIALVSGVGGAAEFAALAHRAGVDPALGARVTLGRAATDDARQRRRDRRLGARQRRALADRGHRLLPHAARAGGAGAGHAGGGAVSGAGGGGRDPGALLAGEYAKFLAAELGLTGFGLHAALRAEHAT